MPDDQEEKSLVAWIITEALEELEFNNLLSRQRVDYYYDLIGNRCYLFDLLPGKQRPDSSDVDTMVTWIKSRIVEVAKRRKENLMSHSAIILGVHKDKLPEEKFMTKALSDFDTCLCVAYVDTDGSIAMDLQNGTTNYEGIQEMSKETPHEKVIFLGKYESDFLPEDLQPFVLVEEKYNDGDKSIFKPTLVCCLEGEFPQFVHEESNRSTAFFAFSEFLQSEVVALWDKAASLEDLVKEMDEPKFRKKIQLMIGERGVVTFIAGVEVDKGGKIWSVGKNPLAGSAEWGWTSNNLGFSFSVSQTKSEEPKKETASWRKGKAAAASTTASVPTVPGTGPQPDTSKSTSEVVHYPPANVRNDQKLLKDWFAKNHVEKKPYPQGWKSGTVGIPESMLHPSSALRSQKGPIKSLQDLPKPADTGAGVTSIRMPIIPPEAKKTLEEILDKYTNLPETVEDVQAQEKDFATFWEQMGVDFKDTLRYDITKYHEIGKAYAWNLAILVKDYRNEILKLNPRILDKEEAGAAEAEKAPAAEAKPNWRKGKVA